MAARSDEFSERLAFGEDGEHLVARFLMSRGVVLSPLYQFQNHDRAPVALWEVDGAQVSGVLPDLACWNKGRAFFAEVKRKTRWVHWEGARETGFDQRLWREYRRIRTQSGVPVWVFFVHEQQEPCGIYLVNIDKKPSRVWDGRNKRTGRLVSGVRGAMTLFDYSELTPVRSGEAVAA